MSQGRRVFSFRADDGEPLPRQDFDFGFLGYVEVCGDIILTGGWRGYTDLSACDRVTRKKLWSRSVKSKRLQKFSAPCFLNKDTILSVNFSAGLISIIHAASGREHSKLKIPLGVVNSDVWRSYRLVDGAVIFLAESGKLLLLDTETLVFSEERLAITHLTTNTPCYLNDKMVFRDTEHTYTLCD
jgi:hypothetical protein